MTGMQWARPLTEPEIFYKGIEISEMMWDLIQGR